MSEILAQRVPALLTGATVTQVEYSQADEDWEEGDSNFVVLTFSNGAVLYADAPNVYLPRPKEGHAPE